MIDKPVINTDLKKYDKAYVVEDDILWEVFGDGYSKAQVIWDKENICDVLNALHQENIDLDDENARLLSERIKDLEQFEECIDKAKQLKEENEQLQTKIKRQDVTIQTLTENIEKLSDDSKMLELLHKCQEENEQLRQTIKGYEYQIKKGYTNLTYEEMLEKECENDE